MKKKILIGSIIAVALLTLVSFSSVVGYNSVDKNPVPDLDCDGEILIIDVKPNSFIIGSCEVINVGEPDSLLDWEIESYPDWGTWTFNPESGTGLEEGGIMTIDVGIIAPSNPNSEFIGEVTFINSNDPSDFCIVVIQVSIKLKVQRIKDLVQSIDLWKIIVNPDGALETLEEVSSILEEEDVRNYIEKTSDEGCGCEDDNPELLWWPFEYICYLLFPIVIVLYVIGLITFTPLSYLLQDFARSLGCVWAYEY